MTNKEQILKDFRERFTSGYGDGTEYRKIVDTNASHIESFLLTSLDELEKSVREEERKRFKDICLCNCKQCVSVHKIEEKDWLSSPKKGQE